VKVRCTDSIVLTAPRRKGDQMLEVYSNSNIKGTYVSNDQMLEVCSYIGQTYVSNALTNVVGCLEMKHFCITLALD